MNKKINILLVEDDALLGPLYTLLLEEQGYSVTLVSSADEVLYLYKTQHHFSLTLLDMMLPQTSGLDLLPQMLKHQPTARIIMLSNLHQPHLQHQALSAGALSYMIKSEYTPDTFISTIQQFLAVPTGMG